MPAWGIPHCPDCGREITAQTVEQIVDTVKELQEGSRIMVLAPVVKDRKGEYKDVFEDLRKQGYARVRVDGKVRDLSEDIKLDKNKKHAIEAVMDRLVVGQGSQSRIADSVETALKLGQGVVLVAAVGGEELPLLGNTSPAFMTASAWARSRPATSASTVPMAPARSAPASALSRKSTPIWF